jgi:subtilisin family serine protease
MNPFFSCSLNDYELVSNNVSYLIDQHAQIVQFIKSNFSKEYHHLLAKPEKVGNKINWYTDSFGEFKRVEAYTNDVRHNIINIYNARKFEIEKWCNELSISHDFDKQLWAVILKEVFNPDHLLLFSNGQQVLIVWGIKSFKQSDYHVPFDRFEKDLLIPQGLPIDTVLEKNNVSDDAMPETDESMEDYMVAMNETSENSGDTPVETSDNNDEGTLQTTEKNEDNTPQDKESPERPASDLKKKNGFYRALDQFEVFASRYWWLLIILLLLLLWFLLQKCDNADKDPKITKNEMDEYYEEIMPRTPRKRTIPIDTNQFIEDEQTGSVIVGGLVNIAVVDQQDVFKRMAVALKQKFSGKEYKIVYYDEATSRLQFSFPESQGADIKEQIRAKLPNYELLIWDESVFQSSKKCNDPFYQKEAYSWHMKAIHLENAWNISQGNSSVIVAVVDDGFDLQHLEFKGKNIVKPYNVVTDNERVYSGPNIFHGTHVAGLVLANANNHEGGSGVAPNSSFMPIQIGNGQPYFTLTDVVDGILYALNHGADVINVSLGRQYGPSMKARSQSELLQIIASTGKDEEKFWKELFKLADKKNACIVLAGGNEDIPIGIDPMQRSNQVLKVLAVDSKFKKAGFSNYCNNCYNNTSFLSAPGVKIFSSMPGNKFSPLEGTSMAAPIVAGAVALMKAVNPRLTNVEVFKILHQSAKSLSDRSAPPLLQVDRALEKVKNR